MPCLKPQHYTKAPPSIQWKHASSILNGPEDDVQKILHHACKHMMEEQIKLGAYLFVDGAQIVCGRGPICLWAGPNLFVGRAQFVCGRGSSRIRSWNL